MIYSPKNYSKEKIKRNFSSYVLNYIMYNNIYDTWHQETCMKQKRAGVCKAGE